MGMLPVSVLIIDVTDLYLQFTSRPQKVSIINFINKSFIYTMIRVIKS